MTTTPTISVLDLAVVREGETVAQALRDSVSLARTAEDLGYARVWYAEHHNMGSIASSATSVLIGHVADHTRTIRLGAGGVMLPNHSPLVIAEQFGTLAELHPGRIDLGLGRAPGTDMRTLQALRRDPSAAEHFPSDVRELRAYLSDRPPHPGITATPGAGTHVPLYILGSSLFGAQLAALLGLPYGFASHFAPDALEQATALYRERFEPSAQLAEPYVIAGVNVLGEPDPAEAAREYDANLRFRVRRLVGRGRHLDDEQLDAVMGSPAAQQVVQMSRYTAVGGPAELRSYLEGFVTTAGADELMVVPVGSTAARAERSLGVLAEAMSVTEGDGE